MTKKEDNLELNQLSNPKNGKAESDTAGKSLSEALEVSFKILKIIMVVLIFAFLASGFKTVNPDERALVLRFGKIRGVGDKRVLDDGLKWILPYPIDEMVKIPAERIDTLSLDSFWYYMTDQDRLPNPPAIDPNKPLNPIRDGYCLTRSEKHEDLDTKGNDYNLVHTQWQVTYQIGNPELFFKNVTTPDVRVSDIYQDVFKEGLEPILKNVLEDAVVTEMVRYTIDEAITSKSKIRDEVKSRLEKKLDDIGAGVIIKTVQLEKTEVPRQVKKAFELSIEASVNRETDFANAQRESTDLLNKTAGPVARQLYEALNDENTSEDELEKLWAQLKGTAKEKISSAEVYATSIAHNAETSAQRLKDMLPKYRENPDIVISRLYYEMLNKVYSNADEIMALNNKAGASGSDLWLLLNRDSSLKMDNKEQSTQK